MYAENTFGHRTKERINMFFKNSKRWNVVKMFNKDIQDVIASVKKLFMCLLDLEVICHIGMKESCDLMNL